MKGRCRGSCGSPWLAPICRLVFLTLVLASCLEPSSGAKQRLCFKLFEFKCNDGDCIPTSWRCNGFRDCLDNSDELGCPGGAEPATVAATTTPPTTTARPTTEAPTTRATTPAPTTTAAAATSTAPTTSAPTTAPPPAPTTTAAAAAATSRSRPPTVSSRSVASAATTAKTTAGTTPSPSTTDCNRLHFYCPHRKNHKCIPLEWVCDGTVDCKVPGSEEGLDERNCKTTPPPRKTVAATTRTHTTVRATTRRLGVLLTGATIHPPTAGPSRIQSTSDNTLVIGVACGAVVLVFIVVFLLLVYIIRGKERRPDHNAAKSPVRHTKMVSADCEAGMIVKKQPLPPAYGAKAPLPQATDVATAVGMEPLPMVTSVTNSGNGSLQSVAIKKHSQFPESSI